MKGDNATDCSSPPASSSHVWHDLILVEEDQGELALRERTGAKRALTVVIHIRLGVEIASEIECLVETNVVANLGCIHLTRAPPVPRQCSLLSLAKLAAVDHRG